MSVNFNGRLQDMWYYAYDQSLRPVVRLKADVTTKQDASGVWKLQ